MTEALLGSIISGTVSAGSTAAGLITNGNLNKRNREWNAEQAAINRAFQSEEAVNQRVWNEQMMNKENEYNSASAQYARLLQTGMNPSTALSMISGEGNASASVQGSSMPSGAQASMNDPYGSSIASSLVGGIPQSAGEIYSQYLDNYNKQTQNSILDATKDAIIKAKNLEPDAALASLENLKKDYQLKDVQMSISRCEAAMKEMDKDRYNEVLDFTIKGLDAKWRLDEMNITETDVRGQLEMAQKGLIPKEAALLVAQRYYYEEVGKHAGDKTFEQFLVGEFGDRFAEFGNMLLDKFGEGFKEKGGNNIRENSLYQLWSEGKITDEQFVSRLQKINEKKKKAAGVDSGE